MTRRNQAENVSEEELKKLVFIPFANPFRVYELWKDVEAFLNVFEHGAAGYSFNSVGFWRSADDDLHKIPLQTSLTLQTAILMDQLEWEDWGLLPGAQLPTVKSVEKLLPGYSLAYDPAKVENPTEYKAVLKDRFDQRRVFLQGSDLHDKPDLLADLVRVLRVKG
jgi:phosphoenolpyruvate carboxykinase (ATP)